MATFGMASNSGTDDEADGSQHAATDPIGLPTLTPQRTERSSAPIATLDP